MASTSGKGWGGKREGSGRKRKYGDKVDRKEAQKAWQRSHRRIYLETNIFQSWLHVKFLAGFETCSDNAFAAHLLTQELLRRYFKVTFDFYFVVVAITKIDIFRLQFIWRCFKFTCRCFKFEFKQEEKSSKPAKTREKQRGEGEWRWDKTEKWLERRLCSAVIF